MYRYTLVTKSGERSPYAPDDTPTRDIALKVARDLAAMHNSEVIAVCVYENDVLVHEEPAPARK